VHTIIPQEDNVVRVNVSGKLTQADYDQLIPSWEATIGRHGKMRLLLVMRDFHGWEPGAAWDDFRFDREHGSQVERVAMVGEKKWQEWIAKLGALFAATKVRYFDASELDAAKRWVRDC
jgi:hypothetical protein